MGEILGLILGLIIIVILNFREEREIRKLLKQSKIESNDARIKARERIDQLGLESYDPALVKLIRRSTPHV